MSKFGAEEAADLFDFDVERRGDEEDLYAFRNVLCNWSKFFLKP